jgi:hypothetical protein
MVKTRFSIEEQKKVFEALNSLGIPFTARRRTGTDDVEIIFQDIGAPEDITDLVNQGRRAYRLRNKDQYDNIGFENYTSAQINTYIDNNVTDLASVKVILKLFARLILYIIKHMNDDV